MSEVSRAIKRAQNHLLKLQHPEGYWGGELEADASVTAGYIPLMKFLGIENRVRFKKVANFLLKRQLPDGSWSLYYGGSGDLNVTVQSYFALKLLGFYEEEFMVKARQFILSRGGIESTHTFTKFLLAPFRQYPWGKLPHLPPELIYLPTFYHIASWARETIASLILLEKLKPAYPLPPKLHISELFTNKEKPLSAPIFSWRGFFIRIDKLLKFLDKSRLLFWRGLAYDAVLKWLIEHQEEDGSWGGIMLPWVYALVTLRAIGYGLDHPLISKSLKGLEDFVIQEEDELRLQPALSPIWDTAWSLLALVESGVRGESLIKAAHWLLSKQILEDGDWKIRNPKLSPGGWSFEFHNRFYPDIDDSSLVPLSLIKLEAEGCEQAIRRAINWILGMQSPEGGWAAFDQDSNRHYLTQLPWADFLPPVDPPCPDVTGHVLELLGELGYRRGNKAIDRAVNFLKRRQEPEGCWYGRWGINYIYGTSVALCGLKAIKEDMGQDYVKRAADWLKSCQNGDGGWGESPLSYEDSSYKGRGSSTPSQTSWAILGLIAEGESKSSAVSRGIDYLLKRQKEDGGWHELEFTGSGFPKVFYLRYHLYPIYFPLLALARFEREVKA